jgi:hypothetical protein
MLIHTLAEIVALFFAEKILLKELANLINEMIIWEGLLITYAGFPS